MITRVGVNCQSMIYFASNHSYDDIYATCDREEGVIRIQTFNRVDLKPKHARKLGNKLIQFANEIEGVGK